jgi:hypothetical protein
MKHIVELKNSISTDTLSQDVYGFDDQAAPLVENNGIHKLGGITNIEETKSVYTDTGYHAYTENGQHMVVVNNGDNTANIKVDDKIVGVVSSWGVESKTEVKGFDDVALTADGTYLGCKLAGGTITLTEWSLDNTLLHSRNIVFTNISSLFQFVTSLSFVRYEGMHYADSAEFAMRLGEQLVILQESNTGISINLALQSTGVTGGADILCSAIYQGWVVFAGASGRVGSFDGSKWKNYDGTGSGVGPYNNATVLGAVNIRAMIVYNGQLIVAGDSGRLGSFSSGSWRNYDGTGGGNGLSNNGTIIGANQINCMGIWNTFLVVGGGAGLIGCFDGSTLYVYTTSTTAPASGRAYIPPVSNGVAVGANAPRAMATLKNAQNTDILVVASDGGKIASFDYGWIKSDGLPIPVKGENWTARTSTAAVGGWASVAYGNGVFVAIAFTTSTTGAVQTSPDGITWTARTSTAASGGWQSVAYGNGVFVAIANTTSTTGAVQTSPDGITWTARTSTAASGTGWRSITYGNGVFVAVSITTSTTGAVQTSPDGITWTARASTAASGGGWQSVAYGNGLFVSVSLTTSTTGAVQTSPDGITWTARTSTAASGNGWRSITYGNGVFVAMANTTSTTGAVQTSPDGITWTARTSTAASGTGWQSMAYGNGLFASVSLTTSTTGAVQTSPDGITWTARTSTAASGSGWQSVAYGNGLFVSVAFTTSTTGAVQTSVLVTESLVSDNSTIVSTDNITAIANIDNTAIVGSALGKVGNINIAGQKKSYNGSGSGSGAYNNATAIGTVSINSIIQFGLNIVIGGASSRLASWDGTNWKNYDGSGTGTGPYSQDILSTANIYSLAVQNGLLMVSGGSGAVNSMSMAGVYSQFYSESGAPVANLLSNMISGTYLYVYRYENGLYLIALVNNNINKIYVLNNPARTVSTSKGRYCVPQYNNGKTRHIVTETPRFDGSNLYVYSVIGYTDFVNFQNYQQYTSNGLVLSSVLNSQIGWNYADLTYKLTSSATAVYNHYGPVPVPSPVSFDTDITSNSNTLIVGHGKLTNAFGNSSSKPFEIRTNWISPGGSPGSQSYLSAAVIDQYSTDALGVLITGVGEFDETYQPHIADDATVLYRYNGNIHIVKIGEGATDKIQSINGRLYKINTLSPQNIWDSVNGSLEVGSMDYNGKMFFTSGSAPASTFVKAASQIEGRFSNSVDTGDKLTQITGLSAANIEIFGYRLPISSSVITGFQVDTYVNDAYSFSTYSDGSEFVAQDPATPLYVTDARLPVPVGAIYSSGTAYSGGVTIFLGSVYDGYEIGNDVTGNYTPFSLFGQLYLFDGLNIYAANSQGGIVQSVDLLCNAAGMQYIAQTPGQAFFLSSFDNSLYSFTGGRNLAKGQAMTALPIITKGEYNTHDNSLLLDATDSLIWVRDGLVTRQFKDVDQTALRLYSTNKGMLITNNANSWQYTYYPQAGSAPRKLMFQTAYHGQRANQKSRLREWIITIYNDRKDTVHLTLTEKSKDQDRQYEHATNKILHPKDWDVNGYAWLRVIPKYPLALGSSLQVDLEERAYILEVSTEWEDSTKAVISADKTR